MALTPDQRLRLAEAADEHGVDEADLVEVAERIYADDGDDDEDEGDEGTRTGRPMNERLLIGHLPYLRVNELRTLFLGLDPAPDGELFTGEWLEKHGGASSKPTTEEE